MTLTPQKLPPMLAGLSKMRVSYVTIVEGTMGFVTGQMYVHRVRSKDNNPDTYEGPVHAGWANLVHTYPEIAEGKQFVGVLVAHPEGQWKGLIDWVKATDEPVPFTLEGKGGGNDRPAS